MEMSQDPRGNSNMASKMPEKAPSKKRNHLDASKRPETVTTLEEIVKVLKEKDSGLNISRHDLMRMQNGVENFALELVFSVIQGRKSSQQAPKTGKKGTASSTPVPRVTSQEIWRALATCESYRPIARRFFSLGLVPAEFQDLFSSMLTTQVEVDVEDEDVYSDTSDINDFLLEPDQSSSPASDEEELSH